MSHQVKRKCANIKLEICSSSLLWNPRCAVVCSSKFELCVTCNMLHVCYVLHVTCDASCVPGSYLWHLGAHRLHFRQHHRAPADRQKNSLSHLFRLWAEMSQMGEQRAADNPHSITRHNDEFKLLFRWFPPSSHPHILTTTNPLPSAHCAWAGWDTGERNLWEDAVVIRSQIILTRGVSIRKKEISFRNYHEFFDKIKS